VSSPFPPKLISFPCPLDSIVRNNFVSNEENGIVISESHNNEIYNNTVSNSGSGIDIDEDPYENVMYNNTLINIQEPSEAHMIKQGRQGVLHQIITRIWNMK
jgi:parallel beta-helix repeat protein